MEWSLEKIVHLFTTLGVVISIATVAEQWVSRRLYRKRKSRHEDYEFAKRFLNEIKKEDNSKAIYEHPFLIEKGFSALSGKDNLSAEEILYCLRQNNPSFFLNQYPFIGKKYLTYSRNDHLIVFTKKYQQPWQRTISKYAHYVCYFIFCIAAYLLSIMIFSKQFLAEHPWWQVALILSGAIVFLFSAAAIFLTVGMKIRLAEELVGTQQSGNNKQEAEQLDKHS